MAYPRDTNEEAARSVRSIGESVSDKAANLTGKAGEKIGQAMESAEAAANTVAAQGREASENVQQVAGNLKTAVDKSVKDQPMATLAVAAVMGFVIGALWKS